LEVIVPEVEGIENNNDLADAKMDLEAFINVGRVLRNVACSPMHSILENRPEFKTTFKGSRPRAKTLSGF
jgi:hypothetical protein